MPDTGLAQWQKDFSAQLEKKLSDMSTDALAVEYGKGTSGYVPEPEVRTDGLLALGHLIAQREGDRDTDVDPGEQQMHDSAVWRRAERRRQLAAEIKRRGLRVSWADGHYALEPDPAAAVQPAPPNDLFHAPLPDAAAADPVAPPIETNHYDDGHSFGWKLKKDEPVPDAVDTGHYDDGHSFGWKLKHDEPNAANDPGGVQQMQRAVSRAGIYALVGTIVLLLLGGFGFAALRGSSPTVASDATTNATASSRASGSTVPTQAPNGIICPAGPDISITLSGAVNATATKSCEPWVSLAQRNARPNTPYCRLEGIPNKPNVVAGVYASQVMFMLSGTKYQLVFQYVADVRSKATNGTLPVTLPANGGDGILQMSSWPATDEIPGRGTVTWTPASGTYTIGADGTTGTIDADFTSNDGRTMHVKGSWTVAKGCPPVG